MIRAIPRYAGFLLPAFWSFGLLAGVYWSGGSSGVAKLVAVEAPLALLVSVIGWGQNSILLAGYWSKESRDVSRLLGQSLVTILLIGSLALMVLTAFFSAFPAFYSLPLPLPLIACAALTDCLVGLVASFYRASLSLLTLSLFLAAYYLIPLLSASLWLPSGDAEFIGAAIVGRAALGIVLVTIVAARRAHLWPVDFGAIWRTHIWQGASLVPATFVSQFLVTFPRIMIVQLLGMTTLERVALSLKVSGLLQGLLFNPVGQLWLVYALQLNAENKTLRANYIATAFISAAILAFSFGAAGVLLFSTKEQTTLVLLVFAATALLAMAVFYNTGIYFKEQLQLAPIVYIPALAVALVGAWLFGNTLLGVLAAWCAGVGTLSVCGWLVSDRLGTKPLSLSLMAVATLFFAALLTLGHVTSGSAWIASAVSAVVLLSLALLPVLSKSTRSDLREALSKSGLVPTTCHTN